MDRQAAIDHIWQMVCRALSDGRTDLIDYVIENMDVEGAENFLLITYLTAMRPASSKLKNYATFFRRVRVALESRGVDVDKVLAGLEPRDDSGQT